MTLDQLKAFLTRTGQGSRVVICGDIAQVSPRFKGSGLARLIEMIDYYDVPAHVIQFGLDDIRRSDQCKMWVEAFEKWEQHEFI
jgi:phosphate starvation-inducible PhoH-like protein